MNKPPVTNTPISGLGISPPDMATILASAQEALRQVIDTKPDTERLLAEMVRLCGGALAAGGAGTWVTQTPDTPQLILEHNLEPLRLIANGAPIAGLNVAVRRAARESKPVIVPPFFVDQDGNGNAAGAGGVEVPSNPSPLELLFIPMKMHGKAAMVLMMAVPSGHDAGMHRTQINFLQKMVGAVEQTLTERHLTLLEKDHGSTSTILKFAEQVHKHLFVREVAVDIANLTRDALHADRSTVEVYPKVRKKIVAVSNVDEPNKRSAIFQAQRLILDYVRDRQVSVILDRAAAKQLVSDPSLSDAATAYFAASPFDAFLAAPIKEDDKVLGVVLTEYADSKKGQAHGTMLTDLCRVAASSVTNAIAYENIPLRKTLHTIGSFIKAPMSSKRTAAMTICGILLIALVIVGTIPMDFSIKADCNLKPVKHHTVVAPLKGRIKEVLVRAGEHVYPDPNPLHLPVDQLDAATQEKVRTVKPLLIFDTSDLLSEKTSLLAELAEFKAKPDEGDASVRRQIMAKLEAIRARLEQTEAKIAASRVYSPIEGKVMTEKLEARKGTSVSYSEPLVEIDNFDEWVLEVEIPESEVATVRSALEKATRHGKEDGAKEDPGIEIEYILYPWPETRYTVRARGVGTLQPSVTTGGAANVFRLEIPVEKPGFEMSGVTGRAKIHIGNKPLATQWLRSPMRLYRMTVGF